MVARRCGSATRTHAILRTSVAENESDERDVDDPVRLAHEARENTEKAATELRAARVPIETEPPTLFRAS
jgi:hypothetical protein